MSKKKFSASETPKTETASVVEAKDCLKCEANEKECMNCENKSHFKAKPEEQKLEAAPSTNAGRIEEIVSGITSGYDKAAGVVRINFTDDDKKEKFLILPVKILAKGEEPKDSIDEPYSLDTLDEIFLERKNINKLYRASDIIARPENFYLACDVEYGNFAICKGQIKVEVPKPAESAKTPDKKTDKNLKDEFKIKKETRSLPVPLSDAELADMVKDLSRKVTDKADLEEKKKAISNGYNAQIKELQKEIVEISKSVNSGYKDMDVPVEIRFNSPRVGKKTAFRMDTGKPLGPPDDMTPAEKQDMFINSKDIKKTGKNETKQGVSENKPAESETTTSETENKDEKVKNETVSLKDGDNGSVFKFPNGRTADVVEYTDVTKELTPDVCKKSVKASSMAGEKGIPFKIDELLNKQDLPEGSFRLIRGHANGNIGYFIQILEVKPEAAAPVAEPVPDPEAGICGHPHADGVRTCKKEKGHKGGHSYGAAKSSAEVLNEGTAEEEEATEMKEELTEKKEEAPTQSIQLFLAQNHLSVMKVEEHLRSKGKLGFTMELKDNPKAQTYVRENIKFLKELLTA